MATRIWQRWTSLPKALSVIWRSHHCIRFPMLPSCCQILLFRAMKQTNQGSSRDCNDQRCSMITSLTRESLGLLPTPCQVRRRARPTADPGEFRQLSTSMVTPCRCCTAFAIATPTRTTRSPIRTSTTQIPTTDTITDARCGSGPKALPWTNEVVETRGTDTDGAGYV